MEKKTMAYMTHGARFGGHASFAVRGPMSDDAIRQIAPSVFAEEAHDSRSSRYTYIPTIEIVRGLQKEGFAVVAAVQGKSRTEGKAEFTKHMLRFRHPDFNGTMASPEAVLVNSHDGTSSYRLFKGVFRSICTNSMICMEDGAVDLTIQHKGDIVSQVIEGTFEVVSGAKDTIQKVEHWQALRLSAPEREILAEAAHTLRFADSDGEVDTPIRPAQLLQPRRREDVENTLWNAHNVIQENVIRGGLTGIARDANNRQRRVSTREIRGIDQDVKLNRALWQLSARMAELKAA